MAEVTCFVVDVGSLGDQWLKPFTYVEYVLLNKVQAQRKTDYVQLVLANVAGNDASLPVEHLAMLPALPRAPVSIADVKGWLSEWYTSHRQTGQDMLFNGLLVSVLKLKEFVGKRKMRARMVVFTCQALQDVSDAEVATFAEQCPFELIVCHCGARGSNGESWQRLGAEAQYGVEELVQCVADPRPKLTRPVRTFQGQLRLGDPQAAELQTAALCINVEGVPGTKHVTSAARKVVRKDAAGRYHAVKSVVEYRIGSGGDGGRDGGGDRSGADADMVNVSAEHVRKAYRYGSDYVDLPPSLDAERRFRAQPALDIRGFMDADRLPRHYLCSEALYVLPDAKHGTRGDYLGFVTLVDALIKLKRVIVARHVPKAGNDVQMCCLSPVTTTDKDRNEVRVLVMSRLPMSEDERTAAFPRLCGGRDVRPEPQDEAMARFVDSMDLDAEPDSRVQPWFQSDGQIQKYSDVALEQSTLPLPQRELLRAASRNPLALPAISLHRQQQVLLECVHQKCIVGDSASGDFDVPGMSPQILDKITPRHRAGVELSRSIKQQFALEKREAAAKQEASLELGQQFEEQDPDLFDLDLLLARGAR